MWESDSVYLLQNQNNIFFLMWEFSFIRQGNAFKSDISKLILLYLIPQMLCMPYTVISLISLIREQRRKVKVER